MRDFNELSWPIAQMLFLFIYMFSTGTIAAHSIGREGPSLWVLKTMPLSGKHIILVKLWISWLIPFVFLIVVVFILGFLLVLKFLQFVHIYVMKALITIWMFELVLIT